MSRYVLSPEALTDLRHIREWIGKNNPARAVSYIQEIRTHFALLAKMPNIGRSRVELGAGIRSAVHGNFIIYYQVRERDIVIARVLHAKRHLSQDCCPEKR